MSFRCLFIIRSGDTVDNTDLQPFCYKSFDNINKIKSTENPNSVSLKNFNEWYQCVINAVAEANYANFNENSIKDFLSDPIYAVKTDFDVLEPCIIMKKNNFVFGGLIYNSVKQPLKTNFKYQIGTTVDFISVMTSYFFNIIRRNPKSKMADLIMEFYYFIKIMCPYGTPVTSNSNFVEFFKNSDNILKSMTILSPEKSVLSINQLPVNLTSKTKELKINIKEVVNGVQHENKSGQLKYDIDIIGEIIISTSNFDPMGEIDFTVKSSGSNKFFSKSVITDVLLHPSCLFCSYQTPATISMLNRKPSKDLSEKLDDNSPNSPNLLANENSLVQSVSRKLTSIDSNLLNRRLQSISQQSSLISNNGFNKLSSSFSVKIKPWSDSCSLMSYKIMQYPTESEFETVSIPFVTSLKCPEPPIICSYQLEDMSTSSESTSNVIFRLKLNPNVFLIGEKIKSIEFSKLEVIFPFPNRHPIYDTSKCNVSQGKAVVLEQNRHIMVWNIGSILKKNEATLMGTLKFQIDPTQSPFVDKFCVQSNAYAQVNFTLKSGNLSGLSMDTRSVLFSVDSGVKIIQSISLI